MRMDTAALLTHIPHTLTGAIESEDEIFELQFTSGKFKARYPIIHSPKLQSGQYDNNYSDIKIGS